jgi:hypothetical protein
MTEDAATLLDRQAAMLSQLAEAALELALHLKERAIAAEEPERLVTAFGKAARAVRLSLSLQAQLAKPAADAPDVDSSVTHIQRVIVSPPRYATRESPDRETPDQMLSTICNDLGLDAHIILEIKDALARKQDIGELTDWLTSPHPAPLE